MADHLQQIEAGARVFDKHTSGTTDMSELLRDLAEKDLAKKDSERALQSIRNPERTMSEADMLKLFNGNYGKDELEMSTTPPTKKSSTEQNTRKDEAESHLKAINELAKKGYDSLSTAKKDLLRNNLEEVLYNHPAMRIVAEKRDIDITDPVALRDFCQEEAVKFLKNPKITPATLGELVNTLATAEKPDFKALNALLDEQTELTDSIQKLKTKIGTPAVGGTAATGMELTIFNKNDELKKYKSTLDTTTTPPTVKREYFDEQRFNANKLINEHTARKKLFKLMQNTINSRFKAGKSGSESYDDLIVGGGSKRVVDNTDYINYVNDLEIEIDKMDKEVTEAQSLVAQINQDEKKIADEISRLTTERDQEKAKLAEKERELKENKTKVAAEQDKIKGLQDKLTKSIRDSLETAVLDKWAQASESVGAVEVTGQEGKILELAKKTLLERVYSKKDKRFNMKFLDQHLKAFLRDGIEKRGIAELANLKTIITSRITPVPEELAMIPIIDKMMADPAQAKEFGMKISADMLKIVALKAPQKLEGLFTEDEIAMKALTGDMIGTLIEQAKHDTTLQDQLQEALGAGLNRNNIEDRLRKVKKTTWLKVLLTGLGLISGFWTLGVAASSVVGLVSNLFNGAGAVPTAGSGLLGSAEFARKLAIDSHK